MFNRSVWISGGILLCGVALTTLTATALVRSHEAVVQSQRERAAFGYAELLRNHLQNRETIARTVAATFYPPESFQPGALAPLRNRLLVLLPHINSIVWIPRVSPGDIPAFLAAARIAYPAAGLMGPGRAPAPPEALKSDFYAVLDIEPSTPANLSSLGLVISSLLGPGAALQKAAALSDIVATPPLELVQLPGVLSIVAYVPLWKAGEQRGPLVGYLGFSYRLDRLIGSVLNDVIGPDEGLRVRDMEDPHLGDLYRTGKPDEAVGDIRVPLKFAGRSWEIIYSGRGPTVSKSPLPWLAYMSGGAFVSLLLAAAFFAVTRSSERLHAEKTARERAMRELAMSEARATTVLRHAPVAILIAEAPTGRIVYGNDSVEKICGYDFSDFQSVQDYGKQQAFHPDGRPYRASEWPLARAITQGEIVEAEEIGITRSDGSRAFISVNAAPIRDEQGNIISAVVAFVDITERRRRDLEKAEEEEKRQLVMRELTHRIKNLFAVVQAMVRQIARNSDSVRAFEDGFTGRLQALSFAHDLLVGQNWQGAPIEDVIRAQLRAFLDGAFSRVSLQGPPLWVSPVVAQHLGLAMFELATNAAKYGALSNQEGTVSIEWTDPADGFRLTWRESGGPPVRPPTCKGFGSVVLERMTAGWGATSVIDYAPAGLVWVLRADPRSAMDSFLTRERPPVGSELPKGSASRDGEPSGPRVIY